MKRTKTLKATTALVLAAGLVVGLAGCGDDGESVTGTTQGEVSAAVTDDPGSTSGSIARASFLDLLGLVQSSGSFTGTMNADARVELRTEGGTFVDVGSVSSTDLSMQSDGGEIQVASGTTVDAGSYTAVRLTLENATLTVDAGSTVGGAVIDADIDIAVGGDDNTVQIEKSLNLNVEGDTETTVVFDLNSESWVNQTTANAGAASDSEVQAAATAFTRATAG